DRRRERLSDGLFGEARLVATGRRPHGPSADSRPGRSLSRALCGHVSPIPRGEGAGRPWRIATQVGIEMTRASAGTPKVSVVIPSYGRKASVERALRALGRQTFPADLFEAVVSIDGSDDGTRESVAAFRAPYFIRGIWNPNRGRAAACNAGIRQARGSLVILLDDDMEPAPDFVESHARAHESDVVRGVLGAVPVAVERDSPPVVQFIATGFALHLEKLGRPGHRI